MAICRPVWGLADAAATPQMGVLTLLKGGI
jgi:hypothetical protein